MLHLSPSRAEKPWQNAVEGMLKIGLQSEEGGPLAWSWTHMYRCWYFKSWNWFSPHFLLWYTTHGVHRAGRLLGSMYLEIWFRLRCGSGSATRQKFRVSIGQVRPKVAGLAEEGRLRENKETTQKERESRVILACPHVHNWMDSLRSKLLGNQKSEQD